MRAIVVLRRQRREQRRRRKRWQRRQLQDDRDVVHAERRLLRLLDRSVHVHLGRQPLPRSLHEGQRLQERVLRPAEERRGRVRVGVVVRLMGTEGTMRTTRYVEAGAGAVIALGALVATLVALSGRPPERGEKLASAGAALDALGAVAESTAAAAAARIAAAAAARDVRRTPDGGAPSDGARASDFSVAAVALAPSCPELEAGAAHRTGEDGSETVLVLVDRRTGARAWVGAGDTLAGARVRHVGTNPADEAMTAWIERSDAPGEVCRVTLPAARARDGSAALEGPALPAGAFGTSSMARTQVATIDARVEDFQRAP